MAILESCDYCKKENVEVQWPGIMIIQESRGGPPSRFYFCSKLCVIEFEKEEVKAEYKYMLEKENEQSTL